MSRPHQRFSILNLHFHFLSKLSATSAQKPSFYSRLKRVTRCIRPGLIQHLELSPEPTHPCWVTQPALLSTSWWKVLPADTVSERGTTERVQWVYVALCRLHKQEALGWAAVCISGQVSACFKHLSHFPGQLNEFCSIIGGGGVYNVWKAKLLRRPRLTDTVALRFSSG